MDEYINKIKYLKENNMDIFELNDDEFDKKLDEIFENIDTEELFQELIECGLEVNNNE
jgi:hypothetical protein